MLAEDDDSGGDRNALIVATLPEDGVYRVLAKGVGGQIGPYELSLRLESAGE